LIFQVACELSRSVTGWYTKRNTVRDGAFLPGSTCPEQSMREWTKQLESDSGALTTAPKFAERE
jgi:hypothetical protein